MAITVEELITRWGLDFDSAKLKSVYDQVDKLKGTLQVVAAGFAAASAAVVGLAKFTSDAGSRIDFLSKRLGTSTETVQELGYAFQALGGLDFDQYADVIASFSKRLQEAISTQSGEAWEGLKLLNFNINSLADSKGNLKNVEGAFYQIADAVASLPASKQIFFADKFFEGEAEKVVNVMQGGSGAIRKFAKEARDLGLIMDKETIAASVQFRLEVGRMMGVLTSLRNTVGAGIIPALSELIDTTILWIKQNKELISSTSIAFSKDLVTIISLIGSAFFYTVNAMAAFIDALGGVDKAVRVLNIAMLGFAIVGTAYLVWIAAIPLAIAAAIALIALIVEDIMTFFEGGNSITGKLVEKVKDYGNQIKVWWSTLGDVSKGLLIAIGAVVFAGPLAIYAIITIFNLLVKKINEAAAWYEEFKQSALNSIEQVATGLWENFKDAFDKVKDYVMTFINWMQDHFTVKNMIKFLTQGLPGLLPDINLDSAKKIIDGLKLDLQNGPMAFASNITPETAPLLSSQKQVQTFQTNTFTFAPTLPQLPSSLTKTEALRQLERSIQTPVNDFFQYVRNQSLDNQDTVE